MSRKHVVQAGDGIDMLAERYGWSADALWDEPENRALRDQRPNRNTLLPGDVVTIPEREAKTVSVATGAVHRFRRKGVPWKLRVRLADSLGPRGALPYRLELDQGTELKGTTSDQGELEHWMPLDAKEGVLHIDGDQILLKLSNLGPSNSIPGARARLVNLGFLDATAPPDAVPTALAGFQRRHELEATGELDKPTVAKLEEEHGC